MNEPVSQEAAAQSARTEGLGARAVTLELAGRAAARPGTLPHSTLAGPEAGRGAAGAFRGGVLCSVSANSSRNVLALREQPRVATAAAAPWGWAAAAALPGRQPPR